MKPTYIDIEQILEEVRKEKNLSKKEIKEIWYLHKEYVKTLMDEPETYNIHFPYLGNLYFSCTFNRILNNRAKKNKVNTEKQERLEKLVKTEKEESLKKTDLNRFVQIGRPIIFKFIRQIYKTVKDQKKTYVEKRRAFKILEKYTYNILEEKDLEPRKR